MIEFRDFVLDNMPVGVIVFDRNMHIVYCSGQAELFFKRYRPPDEISSVCRNIFAAISASMLGEQFPGEICFQRKVDGSLSCWTFRILYM